MYAGLLPFDLPVDQKCQRPSEQDDHTQDHQFALFPDDNGAQHLSPQFEFQCQSNALSQFQLYPAFFSRPGVKAFCGGGQQYRYSLPLQEQDAALHNEQKDALPMMQQFHAYPLLKSIPADIGWPDTGKAPVLRG